MLLENAYVIDGSKLQETIMYDIKMMLHHHATYENAKGLDKEMSFRWYEKYERDLRRDLYWQGLDETEIEMLINYMRELQDSVVHGAYKMY